VRVEGAIPPEPFLVAGCDAIGVPEILQPGGEDTQGRAEKIIGCVVVVRFPGWERVGAAWVSGPAPLPYVPGLLGFREAPLYIAACARLTVRPDLLLVDGQGIAHPRGFGLASHLGVLLDVPAIGVAKTWLFGSYREPGRSRGCSTRLVHAGRVAGRVLRTQTGVRPLYVSPGHRIGIREAAEVVVRLAPRYRIPEPLRIADQWARRLRSEAT
jgi:deoxyribonuclease V